MATNNKSVMACPPRTEMPEFSNLPIPKNINVVGTPGNDTSYLPMEACCEPNPVQIVDRCYLWCEIPKRYFDGTDKERAKSAMSACLSFYRKDSSDLRVVGFQFNAAARPGMVSAKQIGLWVLALSSLSYYAL